jgi:hypothetical protein
MDRVLYKNWLDDMESCIHICDIIIDMQAAEIQVILFNQEDSIVSEDEGEPKIDIDMDTIIPHLERLNHNLDVLKDSKIHLLNKIQDLEDELPILRFSEHFFKHSFKYFVKRLNSAIFRE